MKVARVESVALSLPLEWPFEGAWRFERINPIIVQVTTDDGLEAFGIAVAWNDYQIKSLKTTIDDLSEIIIGQDIFRCEEAWQKLWKSTSWMGHQGYPMFALSAIDSALWSLQAKALNLPLFKLLGGFRQKVPVYASHLLWRDWSIDRLQKDSAQLVEMGFRAVKMRMGNKPVKAEIERLKAVREAVGESTDIMVDVTWSWTVPQAIKVGRQMERYNVYWLEDPIPATDINGLCQIADALDMPVVVGENFSTKYSFRQLIEKRALDIVMIDLQFVGGVTEWMKVARMAQAWDMPVVSHIHNDFSPHLVAAIPNGLIMEYMPWWDIIYEQPLQVKDGHILLTDAPGIGLELNRDIIKKHKLRI
jgi:L-alanine-DL-glutamate epimerase-like enolase superfamily enzyme